MVKSFYSEVCTPKYFDCVDSAEAKGKSCLCINRDEREGERERGRERGRVWKRERERERGRENGKDNGREGDMEGGRGMETWREGEEKVRECLVGGGRG